MLSWFGHGARMDERFTELIYMGSLNGSEREGVVGRTVTKSGTFWKTVRSRLPETDDMMRSFRLIL